jgi:hypothetical protein
MSGRRIPGPLSRSRRQPARAGRAGRGSDRRALAGREPLPTPAAADRRAKRAFLDRYRRLDECETHPVRLTDVIVVDLVHWARGLRARQPASALDHLEQISSPGFRRMAALDRLEAAARAGREDLARTWLACRSDDRARGRRR